MLQLLGQALGEEAFKRPGLSAIAAGFEVGEGGLGQWLSYGRLRPLGPLYH